MDRRNFLKGTALGLVALSAPISLSAAEKDKNCGKNWQVETVIQAK